MHNDSTYTAFVMWRAMIQDEEYPKWASTSVWGKCKEYVEKAELNNDKHEEFVQLRFCCVN